MEEVERIMLICFGMIFAVIIYGFIIAIKYRRY